MNLISIFKEVATIAFELGKAVAPGVVTPADEAVIALLKLVKAIAHPNTAAYRAATAGLSAIAEVGG